jgi:hypothetical protein
MLSPERSLWVFQMKPKKPSPSLYIKKDSTIIYPRFSRGGSVLKKKIDPTVKILGQRPSSLDFKNCPSVTTPGCCISTKPSIFYTGNMVKGITVVHKSCLMPVFTDQEAKDFASMRR